MLDLGVFMRLEPEVLGLVAEEGLGRTDLTNANLFVEVDRSVLCDRFRVSRKVDLDGGSVCLPFAPGRAKVVL